MYYGDELTEKTQWLLSGEYENTSLVSVTVVLDYQSQPDVVTYMVNTLMTGLAQRNNCLLSAFQDPGEGPGVQICVTGTIVELLRYMSMAEVSIETYAKWLDAQAKQEEAVRRAEAHALGVAQAQSQIKAPKESIWNEVPGRHRSNAGD